MLELEEGNTLELEVVSKEGRRVKLEIRNMEECVVIRPSYRAQRVSGRIYPRTVTIRWAIVPNKDGEIDWAKDSGCSTQGEVEEGTGSM